LHIGVELVAARDAETRLVVSSRETDRATADDLVALAQQLSSARYLEEGVVCLLLPGEETSAIRVLEDAQRDEELHSVACNMQKQPGRVYHLYERSDGYRYFSLLSPDEWGKEEKRKEYVASYRLEPDRSWTPTSEIVKRDIQFRSLDAFLHQPSLKLEHFLT
uniref:PsbP domain-containing protein n=1 Tax=Heligmosomoides polygyrus TaxID=6339 RepID=A0A183GT64_HELPZ